MAVFYFDATNRILGNKASFGGAPVAAVGEFDTGATDPATIIKISNDGFLHSLDTDPTDFTVGEVSLQVAGGGDTTTLYTPVSPALTFDGRVEFTSTITAPASTYTPGAVVDGWTLVAGNRFLNRHPAALEVPGIYLVQVSGPAIPDIYANRALGLQQGTGSITLGVEVDNVRVINGTSNGGAVFSNVSSSNTVPNFQRVGGTEAVADAFGELYTLGGVTAQAVGAVFELLELWATIGPLQNVVGALATTWDLKPSITSTYEVSVHVSLKSTDPTVVQIAVYNQGVATHVQMTGQLLGTAATTVVSCSGLISVTSSDALTARILAVTPTNITLVDGQFTIKKVG